MFVPEPAPDALSTFFAKLLHKTAHKLPEVPIIDKNHAGVTNEFDPTGHTRMPLSRMVPGDDGHVLELQGNSEIRQQLLELGFTKGASVGFVRVAPMSDPITVRVRGYQLALRREQAEAIIMLRCPPELDAPQAR